MAKKVEFAHLTWLDEEKEFLETHPLPKELKKSISGWNMQKSRYDKKPTDAFADSLQRQSVEIGDKLQTWKETEEGATDEPVTPPVAAPAAPPAEPPAPPAPEPTPEEKATAEREAKVQEFLTKEGRIHYSDLASVLGHKKFGGVVQVGKFRLGQKINYYYAL